MTPSGAQDPEARQRARGLAVGGLIGLAVVAGACLAIGAEWYALLPMAVAAVILVLVFLGRLGDGDGDRSS
ncbi:hypothetical protein [Nocardioides sp.]|uniref:hypothetical protein n=1 Tax=Nocardioides sp. TaxID=35761 RepID=UPI0027283407|nr:hypothetical protein [Nocardioides sp.]MDO9455374.1 hypothetical protein [Nocardioides sp.]